MDRGRPPYRMKILLLLVVYSLSSVFAMSQTKIDEYGKLISDDEYFHLSNLADELKKDPRANAAIVISRPPNARVGSFLRHFYGVGEAMERFGVSPDRFELISGSETLVLKTELWLVGPGDVFPNISDPRFADLTSQPVHQRKLFDRECLDCDRSPFIDQMIFGNGLDHFAHALAANTELGGDIVIGEVDYVSRNKAEKAELQQAITWKLVTQHKIPANRIRIRFVRSIFASLYLVPVKKQKY
jgi:hypothetical protein